MVPPPPTSTLFPYTTLFRSRRSLSGPGSQADTSNGSTDFPPRRDRKSTRLNSSHRTISYAVFCLKKKTDESQTQQEINVLLIDKALEGKIIVRLQGVDQFEI